MLFRSRPPAMTNLGTVRTHWPHDIWLVSPKVSSSSTLEPLSVSLSTLWKPFSYITIPLVIIITLLAKTPRSEMHPAKYVFGSEGVINQTGGWNTGLAFLFGLLSVQWTVRIFLLRSSLTGLDSLRSLDDRLRCDSAHFVSST